MNDLKILLKARFFRDLPEKRLRAILATATMRTVEKGTVLWSKDGHPKLVYVVLSGRVGLLGEDMDGNPLVIDIYRPGYPMGFAGALLNREFIFTARALDDVLLLEFSFKTFKRMLLENSELSYAAARSLAEAWYRLVPQIYDLKRLTANQRLGRYLLAMSEKTTGKAEFSLEEDQLMIAGILGTTRQSLSRSFAQLRGYGVRKRGRRVVLENVARLRSYCELT